MKNFVLMVSLMAVMSLFSGCSDATLQTNKAVSNHGDEQMWQQFQSKQAVDQLDKDFQK
jgi:outer membrane biogenesis lipoprotein LolB